MNSAPAAGDGSTDARWSAMMAAGQRGDRAAYEALLKDCVPLIKTVGRRAGVNPERIDDVVQDVLITVHRARRTYDPARSFTAWLSVIARRRAIDVLRSSGRQGRREVFEPLSYDSHPDSEPSPEDAWEAGHRARAIEAAVKDLPAGQREAVQNLALQQLSLTEAAAATGKTTGALKVNLHRAFKTLRARFEGGN